MCFLCTESTDSDEGIIRFGSPEAELLEINQIIEKHFWWQINEITGHICGTCWDQLYAFHKFYMCVELAHLKLQQKTTALAKLTETMLPYESEIVIEPALPELNRNFHQAVVKRKRGRPRKELPDQTLLEQIDLNEKVNLSIEDVLNEHEDQNVTDCLQESVVESAEDVKVDLEPALELELNEYVKQESEFNDSVATAVKRRRGRPRKQLSNQTAPDSNELKAEVEQIDINENLSIADVLVEQKDQNIAEDVFESEVVEEPVLEVELNESVVQQENGLGENVAASVKRRRGRPRKQLPDETATDSNELKAEVEQIDLNENLSIAVVLVESVQDVFDSEVVTEPVLKLELNETVVQKESGLGENVAASVKRRRGRPRKQQPDQKPELEQIEDQDDQSMSDYSQQTETESESAEDNIDSGQKRKKKTKKRRTKLKGDIRVKKIGDHHAKKTKEFDEFIKEHHKLQCPFCNVSLEDFAKLVLHTRNEHNQRGYAMCCHRKFFERGTLVDHLRRHQNPELFKCEICQRVLGERRGLHMHMRMHEIKQRGRIYQCDQCPKSFYISIDYERHKLTHIPKEQWCVPCTSCRKTFLTENLMQQHVKQVHLRKFDKICEICGKSIRCRAAFQRHMEEHAGAPQKVIKCHLCESTLTTKPGLARHIKMMHTEENLQPMQCEICLKISPNLQAHRQHILYTHNTTRKHKCSMCEKAFKRPNQLREHLTTHTGEVLYTCPYCPKTFNSNANMHAHRKKKHFKEWQEYHHRHQARFRKAETIISVSVRKTIEAMTAESAAKAAAAKAAEVKVAAEVKLAAAKVPVETSECDLEV